MTKLLIVRHGETEENVRRICQGQMPGTLSPKGIEEAHYIGGRLRDFHIDCCYTSDLQRAVDTTGVIASYKPKLAVYEDSRLRERYFGSFQGCTFPASLDDFTPPEETETPEAIAERLQSFLADIRARHADETVLIVSHGFTIRVLMAVVGYVQSAELETVDDLKNASLTIINMHAENYEVKLFNDTSHLIS